MTASITPTKYKAMLSYFVAFCYAAWGFAYRQSRATGSDEQAKNQSTPARSWRETRKPIKLSTCRSFLPYRRAARAYLHAKRGGKTNCQTF